MDNKVIYAHNLKEHEQLFHKVMQKLKEKNLKLEPNKYKILRREVVWACD